MSSLACGRVLEGDHWKYRIIDALKGDDTRSSTVFKAEIIPHKNVQSAPKWAIIKAALSEKPTTMENLGRERTIYRLADVSSAACFRKIHDVIDDNTIALEWLDTTLAEVKFQPNMRTYALIKTFLNAALASCVVLDDQGYVNTGIVPALKWMEVPQQLSDLLYLMLAADPKERPSASFVLQSKEFQIFEEFVDV